MKKRIAVLISNAGKGTNLAAIISAIETGRLNADIAVVISDSPDAFGIQLAHDHSVPSHILLPSEDIVILLKQTYDVAYVVLAGWKKIIPDSLLDAFPEAILNIHPGIIPDVIDGTALNPDGTQALWNKGKFMQKAIQQCIDSQATYAGSSIHYLTKEFDFGPVLGRCFEKIRANDSVESLYGRLKEKENSLYVDVLVKLCSNT
jgi:phosphoribosylglycinamide formyltransferase-1